MKKKILIFSILIICLFTTSAFAKVQTNIKHIKFSGLSFEWKFDELAGSTSVSDASGNSISGTLHPDKFDFPTFVRGVIGKALSVNIPGKYISSDTGVSSIGVVDQPYAISVWVSASGGKIPNSNIINISDHTNDSGWCIPAISISGGELTITSRNGGKQVSISSGETVSGAVWYNVVHVWDPSDVGNELKLYVNGVLKNSIEMKNYTASGVGDYVFVGHGGVSCSGTHGAFQGGKIDDLQIYNRALSSSEVASLYAGKSVSVKPSPSSGLVGYWPLDSFVSSVFKDKSGHSIDGAYVGGSAHIVPGKIVNAISLDGTDYVELSSLNNIEYSQMTVSAWFKSSDLSFANSRIVSSSNTGDLGFLNGFQLEIEKNGSGGFFDVGNGTGEGLANWSQVLSPNTWYHYVGTYDGTNVYAYINGQQVGSGPLSGDMAISSYPVNIGRNPAYDGDYFKGLVDDVRIYNRALTPKEVLTLYNSRQTIVNDSKNNKVTNGILGIWSFDGKDTLWTGPRNVTLFDRSGLGNDGTSSGLLDQKRTPVVGVLGQAFKFNGVDSCIQSSNGLLDNLTKFTLSGWVKPDVKNNSHSGFFGQNDTVEFGFKNAGTIAGWTPVGGEVSWDYDSSTFPMAKWHHVVFKGDSTGGSTSEYLYVDGVNVASSTSVAPGFVDYGSSAYNFNIGGCGIWNISGDFFAGLIDDVRVYSRSLTDNEIKQLYLMGK